MKRNAYKGIPVRKATRCDKCGAEWEMGTRSVGETCAAVHNYKPPFMICKGKLVSIKKP